MTPKKIAILIATLFFLFWVVVLYAGADHPPPHGFLWIILADFVCAGVVFLRVPAYSNGHLNAGNPDGGAPCSMVSLLEWSWHWFLYSLEAVNQLSNPPNSTG